jgi:hypothetical protein
LKPLVIKVTRLWGLSAPVRYKHNGRTSAPVAEPSRLMEMRYFWIADQVANKRFDVRWHPGKENLADYHSKHHPTSHHIRVRPFYLQEPSSPLVLPRSLTPEELRGCARMPMSAPICRQPLAFSQSQHFRLPRLDRPEEPSPIAVAAAAYRDISLSPFSCHLAPAAAFSPWPAAISCS